MGWFHTSDLLRRDLLWGWLSTGTSVYDLAWFVILDRSRSKGSSRGFRDQSSNSEGYGFGSLRWEGRGGCDWCWYWCWTWWSCFCLSFSLDSYSLSR
jgi:hypothetical protein